MCNLQKCGDHLKVKCKTNLKVKVSLVFFILITCGSFVRTLVQKGNLWGILCANFNFAEKINFILHVFHLKTKIISLKLNKVKSEEGK